MRVLHSVCDDVYLTAGSCIVMLEMAGLAEARPLPASWARLELDDFSSHSSYPAIVQEIKAGWINFYGKLPGGKEEETQQRSLSGIVRELVEDREETEKVGRVEAALFLVGCFS